MEPAPPLSWADTPASCSGVTRIKPAIWTLLAIGTDPHASGCAIQAAPIVLCILPENQTLKVSPGDLCDHMRHHRGSTVPGELTAETSMTPGSAGEPTA